MEYILKITAVAIVSAVLSLVIRKNNPEMALLLGIVTALFCIWCVIEQLDALVQKIRQWLFNGFMATDYFTPLLKCLGISLISQFGVSVCKDGGQSAAATGLELCGSVASAWCLLPLIEYLFGLFEDML